MENLIVSLISLPIIIGLCHIYMYYWKKRESRKLQDTFEKEKFRIEQEYMSKVLNKQIQYEALQSQINPHFLYNTLESIRGEALISGNKTIAVMTEHLSRFFRYCISNKGSIVTIRDEINNILDYFSIQEFRFGEKFHLELDVEKKCYEYSLPKMTIQPLVENAIFHGLERNKNGGTVKVTVFETDANVHIRISDNGQGIEESELNRINHTLKNWKESADRPKSDQNRKNGIALQNVNKRIKLLYGEEYGIYLRSTKYLGTDVMIEIPKGNKNES